MQVVGGTSPRGDWVYVSWRPRDLAPFVDHLWAFEGPTRNPYKRIFPNGCLELIVNLGGPYDALGEHGVERLPRTSLTGSLTGPLVLRQPPRQHCIAARLRPAGAYALLAPPLSEVTGLSVDLHDLLGPDAAALTDRCAAVADVRAQLRVLAAWLRNRTRRARSFAPPIAWAVAELEATAGTSPIATIRERTGLSKARLSRAFRASVGLTPKVYGRIVRLRGALSALQSDGDLHLAELAVDRRFYDQAHMNAEFRALTGLTPREFVAARHPVGDGSTVAELFSKTTAGRPSPTARA
jgi:AraC-like DNA-binding protein